MNCAFYLSRPLDFYPLFSDPIPPELFLFENNHKKENCLLIDQYKQFNEYFPDMEYLIVDRASQPVFYKMFEDMDVLNIPGFRIFPMLFIYATFTIAMDKNPLTLFCPGNIRIHPFGEFAQLLRGLIKNKTVDFNILFLSTTRQDRFHDYFVSDHVYDRVSGKKIRHINSFLNYSQYYELSEEKKQVSGCGEVIVIDALKWMDAISDIDSHLEELFFLLIDAWKDQISINTVIKDVVKTLENYQSDIIYKKMNAMCANLNAKYDFVRNYMDLLSLLPIDEWNNYSKGDFKLKNVTDSILINQGYTNIELEGISGINVLANGESIRIKKQ